MKRILTAVSTLLMAVVLCCSAAFAAAPTSYYIEEVDADIALPPWSDYYFLYPNMPEDSEDLYYLELTPQEINDILVSNGILFDALYYDGSYEIAVQVNEETLSDVDYSELGELERAAVIAASKLELDVLGYTINAMEWVEGENATWLLVEFTFPGDGGWAYQYQTARGGKTLSFTASSAQGVELTDDIRDVTANMALGTVFHSTVITLPGGEEPMVKDPAPSEDPLAGVLEDLDVGGLVAGGLIGAGVGVVVVAVIVVVLVVTGRKKKDQKTPESSQQPPQDHEENGA